LSFSLGADSFGEISFDPVTHHLSDKTLFEEAYVAAPVRRDSETKFVSLLSTASLSLGLFKGEADVAAPG